MTGFDVRLVLVVFEPPYIVFATIGGIRESCLGKAEFCASFRYAVSNGYHFDLQRYKYNL